MNYGKLSDKAECAQLVGDVEEQESITACTDEEQPMLTRGWRRPAGEASDSS